jgi:uncharacterized delta-60 repeat protein
MTRRAVLEIECLESRELMTVGGVQSTMFAPAVSQLFPSGAFDRSFNGGRQTFNYGSTDTSGASAVAVQSDGKVVVVGETGIDMAITRFNTDGSPDTSFILGRAPITFSDLTGLPVCRATAVAIDAQGRIVVAGTATNGPDSVFVVTRLTSSGWFDTSFGIGGRQYWSYAPLYGLGAFTDDQANAVAIDAQGRIVVAGSAEYDTTKTSYFAVARLNSSGWFDTSFGIGGEQYFDFWSLSGNTLDQAAAVAIDAQGCVVLAGSSSDFWYGTGSDIAVARLTSAGWFDPSFGRGGEKLYGAWNFPAAIAGYTTDWASALAVDPRNGNIIVAGGAGNAHDRSDFVLLRLTPSGALDSSFGWGGVSYQTFSSLNGLGSYTYDYASSVTLDNYGNIVVAGTAADPTTGHSVFAVSRVNAAGGFDTSFGIGGQQYLTFGDMTGQFGAACYGVALDAGGNIVLAGTDGANIAVARLYG